MRPRKHEKERYGAWEFLAPTIHKVVGPWRGPDISSSALMAVVIVGICPGALLESISNPKARELADAYAAQFEADPDLVVALLAAIRAKWNAKSSREVVKKFICTHAWCTRPPRGVAMKAAEDKQVIAAMELEGIIVSVETVKKARAEMADCEPIYISTELWHAISELRTRGFEVGWGT